LRVIKKYIVLGIGNKTKKGGSMKSSIVLMLLMFGVVFGQSYYMKVEKTDGSSVILNTDAVKKISFYEVGSEVKISYNITVIDANNKPFPAYSVTVGPVASSSIISRGGACYQSFLESNTLSRGVINSSGALLFSVVYPSCLSNLTGLTDEITLKLRYNDQAVDPENITYINNSGSGMKVFPGSDTEFVVKIKNVILP
jgi:hypothetical protein